MSDDFRPEFADPADAATATVNAVFNMIGPPPSAELPTLARLRQTAAELQATQQALAASQQDLTRALAERDEWKSTADQIASDIRKADDQIAAALRERDEARHDLALAEFETAKLRTALDHLNGRHVEAFQLLAYALHLRQHGEHAPGGGETWAVFDRRCETFLRALNPDERSNP